jgi:hypothetical protein
MTKKPEDVLKEWMQAINNSDLESLLGLYDEKAVLIPTFSNRVLNTPAKIREYFERLSSREELSIALHEKTLIVQSINNDRYALSGIYCWRFALDGELLSFEARFSYMLDLTLSSPIIHHHSSQIPRML